MAVISVLMLSMDKAENVAKFESWLLACCFSYLCSCHG